MHDLLLNFILVVYIYCSAFLRFQQFVIYVLFCFTYFLLALDSFESVGMNVMCLYGCRLLA